jgi:hypothetical protein
MIETLQQGNAFTTEMRDRYYSIVNANIQELLDADTANERPRKRLAIAQATYKNIHRERLIATFPFVSLWMVSANEKVRVTRCTLRTKALVPEGSKAANAKWVLKHSSGFEPPTHHHSILLNNGSNLEVLKSSIDDVLAGIP